MGNWHILNACNSLTFFWTKSSSIIPEMETLNFALKNSWNYIFFLTFSAELCKYNERSGQSKTRMGKLWLNGAAKFLTSLTNVRFFTFFKSISTLLYNSSVYFNQRPSLVVLMLIQDLFQAPANPERNGEKKCRTFFDNCYWNFMLF